MKRRDQRQYGGAYDERARSQAMSSVRQRLSLRGHLISLAYALGFGKLCDPTRSALNDRAYRALPRGQNAHSPPMDEYTTTHTHESVVTMEASRIAHRRKH